MLRLLIIFSTSLQLVFLKWKVEPSALAMILTLVYVERFNYRHNRIKIVAWHRKRLTTFWYVQSGYYITEKLIKCLTELLPTRYSLTIINEINFFHFSMNFEWLMVGLSSRNFYFKIRFLSIFQKFFKEIFLGAVVFFVSTGSAFQECIS